MKKMIIIITFLMLISGCTSNENSLLKSKNKSTNVHVMRGIRITGDSEYNDIKVLLRPLLEGIVKESDEIEKAIEGFKEGKSTEELRDFMLLYYTEELANETCELLLYKNDQQSMIDELVEQDEGTVGYSNVSYMYEKKVYEIVEITTRTKDRIEIIFSEENIYGNIEERIITLEREGRKWYLADLVYSRKMIENFGSIYVY